jgi:hypothetical protein
MANLGVWMRELWTEIDRVVSLAFGKAKDGMEPSMAWMDSTASLSTCAYLLQGNVKTNHDAILRII